jgi:glycosyltransferase involved in cell wall biosynthesis
MPLQISVIMPVYNAAGYVRAAVESALAQPEVAEVILVEDASSDDSLTVCEALAAEDERVHLYRHPDGGNHGAGASRNMAIQKSTCPYIAFLDADDYYLPGRFTVAAQLFESDPSVDGVYEAIEARFESEAAEQRWWARGETALLTTVTQPVAPENLFAALIAENCGYFSGNGLVVRREVFDSTGAFSTHRHEDTAMWIKMAGVARLVPGRLQEPVAVRRMYDENREVERRSSAQRDELRRIMWESLWRWSRQHLDHTQQEAAFGAMLKEWLRPCRDKSRGIRTLCLIARLHELPVHHPRLLATRYFWAAYAQRMLSHTGLDRLIPRRVPRKGFS